MSNAKLVERFLNAFLQFDALCQGRGATLFIDLEHANVRTEEDFDDAIDRGMVQLLAQLEPCGEWLAGLRNELENAGILFKDPVRGWGFNLNAPWPDELVARLEGIERELMEFTTLIEVE